MTTPSLVPPALCPKAGKGALVRSVHGDMQSPGATGSHGLGTVLLTPWGPLAAPASAVSVYLQPELRLEFTLC